MLRLKAVLSALVCLLTMTAFAADTVEISQVRVGLDNATKVSIPTSVVIQLSSSTDFKGEVWITTPDPQGNLVNVKTPIELLAGQPQSIEQTVVFGRLDTSLLIEVRQGDATSEIVARRRLNAIQTAHADAGFEVSKLDHPHWLSLGTIPLKTRAAGVSKPDGAGRAEPAVAEDLLATVHRTDIAKAADFPSRYESLRTLDTVFVAGELGLTESQSAALERWVQCGGHLVLSIGTRGAEFAASPLSKWILTDARTIKTASIGDLEGLKSFATTQAPIPIVSRVSGSLLMGSDGLVLVPSIDGALVTRFAHGLGKVTLVGLDFDRKPLSVWRGLESFVVALAGLKPNEVAGTQNYDRLSRTGITDLASQMHLAVSRFPEVSEHSVLGVLGLILIYMLVVGPLDYVFVHRVLKRPSLTWISFPCVVAVSIGLATITANAGLGDGGLKLRQTEILDMDGRNGFVRSTGWLSAYSGANTRQNVAVQINAADFKWKQAPQPTLSWSATPEENFGGLYRTSGLEIGKLSYDVLADHSGIPNLPVTVRSTQTLRSGFVGTLTGGVVQSRLRRAGAGTFDSESSLTHSLPSAIEDWALAYSGRIYFHSVVDAGLNAPSALEPGKKLLLNGAEIRSREMRTFLTGTSYRKRIMAKGDGGDENIHVQAKYDPTNLDLFDLLRMLSFHDATGGRSYTGLNHSALQNLELSGLMELDRAVLIGRIKLPATQVSLGGELQQPAVRDTFVRILIPVDDSDFVAGQLPKFKP